MVAVSSVLILIFSNLTAMVTTAWHFQPLRKCDFIGKLGANGTNKDWNQKTSKTFCTKGSVLSRPVTSLGHEGRILFWEGSKFFKLGPIVSNYIQHIFLEGDKFFPLPWLQAWYSVDIWKFPSTRYRRDKVALRTPVSKMSISRLSK